MSPRELREIQERLGDLVYTDNRIVNYLVEIISNLRNHDDVLLGPSNRGGIYYYRISKAYALVKGRDYVIPDDLKGLAKYVLPHRIIVKPSSRRSSEEIVEEVFSSTPVPKE